jgi:Tfp pilus assembly protein PilF
LTARAPIVLLSLALAGAGCAPGSVTRVVDGETIEGRPISPEAYAAYAKAELFAAQGDRKQALKLLETALDADPGSPEVTARYGEVLCEERQMPEALERFERALELDPEFAPAFLARARCRSRAGNQEQALVDATTAATLDPMSLETTGEVARLLFALHRPREAWLWLEARILLEPSSRGPHALLLEAAEREHDAERAARARRSLAATSVPRETTPLDAVAAAPLRALERAERRLAADPEDTEAWTAGLVAADLLGDDERFRKVLTALGDDPLPATPAALALLAELVARRCGTEAAAALMSATKSMR